MRTVILFAIFLFFDEYTGGSIDADTMWNVMFAWAVCWDILSWIRGTI